MTTTLSDPKFVIVGIYPHETKDITSVLLANHSHCEKAKAAGVVEGFGTVLSNIETCWIGVDGALDAKLKELPGDDALSIQARLKAVTDLSKHSIVLKGRWRISDRKLQRV